MLLSALPPGQASLLDVATGSADIPRALRRAASRRGQSVDITGLDQSPDVLAEAGRYGGQELSLVRGDARHLPFGDAEFDIVSLCLALHHFDPEDAVLVLTEMWRVARSGVVVIDLHRNAVAYCGVWLLTRTMARNRLTRHDGPLSVLRAYTVPEVRDLVATAGIDGGDVRWHPPARVSLVARKAHA
jgi:ubiquinone/menaquinone biosynthesis C-methylase UbiE